MENGDALHWQPEIFNFICLVKRFSEYFSSVGQSLLLTACFPFKVFGWAAFPPLHA